MDSHGRSSDNWKKLLCQKLSEQNNVVTEETFTPTHLVDANLLISCISSFLSLAPQTSFLESTFTKLTVIWMDVLIISDFWIYNYTVYPSTGPDASFHPEPTPKWMATAEGPPTSLSTQSLLACSNPPLLWAPLSLSFQLAFLLLRVSYYTQIFV